MGGPHALALGELDAEGGEEIAEFADLLRARRVMGAVDQRRLRRLQRLGGGDVGEDHEFLDQPVRLEPLRPAHADELALGVEDELALGQFEVERIALGAFELERAMGGVERLERDSRAAARSSRRAGRRSPPAPARRRAWPPSASSRDGTCGARLRPSAPRTIRTASAGAVFVGLAASTGRWRCARAASARRGRGNRPNCRAFPPRGRAPSRRGRNRRRRRSRR